MEANPETEFEYYLAEKLGRTVGELRVTLSNLEWEGWKVYHGRKAQKAELERATKR